MKSAGYAARCVSLIALVATMGVLAMPARAQEHDENRAAAGQADDEIIVTALRRGESIRDVPISIAAVSGEQIVTQGIEDVQRLAESLPSLVVGGQGQSFGGVNLTIRGVGSNSGDPAVGYYIDEVYIPNPGGFVSQFIDVERVEVLNGPQGTLFGRNTTGGVVHFLTKQPGREFSVQGYGEIGWYDSLGFDAVPIRKVGGTVNVPHGDDLSVRVSVSKVSQANYIYNLERAKPEPNQDAVTVRAGVSIHPGDRFELLLNADYINDPHHNSFLFKNRATPGSSIAFIHNLLTDVGPEAETFRVRSDLSPVADYKEWGLRAKGTYKLTDSFELRSITAYRTLKLDRAADLDVTQATIVHNTTQQDDRFFSQELQGYYEDDRFNILGGLYYFNRDFTQNAQTFASTPFFLLTGCNASNPPAASIAAFCPIVNQVATQFIPLVAGRQPQLSDFLPGGLFETLTGISASTITPTTRVFRTFNVKSYAAFAQANYRLNDQISITAGGRYTIDKKDVDAQTLTAAPPAPPLALDATFKAFTPKLGIEWRPDQNSLAYASVTRGYKSGDLNLFANIVAGEDPKVTPESIWAYEVGAKTALADGTVLLDGSAFYYDYSNYQMNVQFAEGPRVFNMDKVRIYGFEFKPVFRPAQGLRLGGAVTYLNSKVTRSSRNLINPFVTTGGPINPVGLSLPQSPKWKANMFASYTVPIGQKSLTFAIDATYSDRFNNDLFGSFPNPSYTIVNGNIRLAAFQDRWSLNVYARNITNEVYTTSSLFQDSLGEVQFFAPPRTIGIQLAFKY